MPRTSFRGSFPLVFFDCDFDFPQDFLGHQTDGFSESVNACRAVKIEYRLKILVLYILGGVNPAPCHKAVRRADRQGLLKGDAYVKLVVFLQETALDGIGNIPCVVLIIARRKALRKAEKRFPEIFIALNVKGVVQGFRDHRFMLRPQLPQERTAGVPPPVHRVGNVENIAKPGAFARLVD
jgi:hypothetical protein